MPDLLVNLKEMPLSSNFVFNSSGRCVNKKRRGRGNHTLTGVCLNVPNEGMVFNDGSIHPTHISCKPLSLSHVKAEHLSMLSFTLMKCFQITNCEVQKILKDGNDAILIFLDLSLVC